MSFLFRLEKKKRIINSKNEMMCARCKSRRFHIPFFVLVMACSLARLADSCLPFSRLSSTASSSSRALVDEQFYEMESNGAYVDYDDERRRVNYEDSNDNNRLCPLSIIFILSTFVF
jgi:hypothetical protein